MHAAAARVEGGVGREDQALAPAASALGRGRRCMSPRHVWREVWGERCKVSHLQRLHWVAVVDACRRGTCGGRCGARGARSRACSGCTGSRS
eukprot:353756-Chlamydomonas_euryale.AAC.1